MYAAPITTTAISPYLIISGLSAADPELNRTTLSFGRTLSGTLIPTSSPAPALSTGFRSICMESTSISKFVVAPENLILSPMDRSPELQSRYPNLAEIPVDPAYFFV